MEIKYGRGPSQFGPGVMIQLTGEEVASAISAWLVANGVYIDGPRTFSVNGDLDGEIYVDPSGNVIADGVRFSGRGPA